ncbi:hypothetical protein TSAR_011190 [Trichomalopsis sarcophagae]|uniref:Uncharacterized protein n=1 Tax=Trichomalopsis sarcophagae TaxID=543379 RepID=A0A232EKC8_9HYME|nr:hypothetical protein TSAR_011190 [Trichomalopsis sarcophagae]
MVIWDETQLYLFLLIERALGLLIPKVCSRPSHRRFPRATSVYQAVLSTMRTSQRYRIRSTTLAPAFFLSQSALVPTDSHSEVSLSASSTFNRILGTDALAHSDNRGCLTKTPFNAVDPRLRVTGCSTDTPGRCPGATEVVCTLNRQTCTIKLSTNLTHIKPRRRILVYKQNICPNISLKQNTEKL